METAVTHEVYIPCDCPTIERCATERYISDVRILMAELKRLRLVITGTCEVMQVALESKA